MDTVFVYTYRYMWKIKGSSNICFKIVTDTEEGLASFEKELLSISDIEKCGREYLSQIDVSKIAKFDNLITEDK